MKFNNRFIFCFLCRQVTIQGSLRGVGCFTIDVAPSNARNPYQLSYHSSQLQPSKLEIRSCHHKSFNTGSFRSLANNHKYLPAQWVSSLIDLQKIRMICWNLKGTPLSNMRCWVSGEFHFHTENILSNKHRITSIRLGQKRFLRLWIISSYNETSWLAACWLQYMSSGIEGDPFGS